MSDVTRFGLVIGVVSVAMLAALLSSRLSERSRIPAPAIFLVAAAAASDVWPGLARIPVVTVQRVVTVALIMLLFDGGMHIGWRRFRAAAGPIVWIGVVGTFLTTGGIAVAAHAVFGFGWLAALLLGAALAPTDPAVVFSVLGRQVISGRTGVLLEGESGVNDPVGIALMASLLAAGTAGGWHAVGTGAAEFALEMAVGAAVGAAGGSLLGLLMQRVPLPSGALYPLRTAAAAGVIYALASVAHGSGFLAVFIAGILVGDLRAPYKAEIERFHSSLASLAEITAFTVLGLTITLGSYTHGDAWLVGLALAALLTAVIRPALVGLLLVPIRMRLGERLFVTWSGLKGAVPILLGTYLFTADVADAGRLYQIVVLVVAFSVIVQGGLVPYVARRAGVAMRTVEPEPWSLGVRFQHEPSGLHRHVVGAGAPADGSTVADLALGEDAWISLLTRDGHLVQVRGDTDLHAGDEVLVLAEPDSDVDLPYLFTGSTERPGPRP
ncbi:MAG: potassium/hydrogen antiporter [Mycobacteriales bacterium]|jgi:cell volume regulation protein A